MKGFILAIIIGASVIGGFKGIYWVFYPDYTYRYKMTVEVNTPDGIKSGSSVIEVHTQQMPEWLAGLSGGHYRWSRVKGEAPIVHLDDKKALVALLYADGNNAYPKIIVPSLYEWKLNFRGIPNLDKNSKEIELTNKYLKASFFALLDDFNEPKTLAVGNYKAISNKFGDPYSLSRITIQLTEEEVTEVLLNNLSWLERKSLKDIPDITNLSSIKQKGIFWKYFSTFGDYRKY